jgi:hypothetical protein
LNNKTVYNHGKDKKCSRKQRRIMVVAPPPPPKKKKEEEEGIYDTLVF